jgi:hypothetical protein
MRKGSSLRNNNFSHCQQWWPSPSAACLRGSFATPLPHFGSPPLPNGLLQEGPFLGEPKHCPSAAIHTWCHNPASLGAANTVADPQFASAQRFICKGNGGTGMHAVLLGNLISIIISSWAPGQHMLAKQNLLGISGEPCTISRFCAMVAVTHLSAAMVCFAFEPRS